MLVFIVDSDEASSPCPPYPGGISADSGVAKRVSAGFSIPIPIPIPIPTRAAMAPARAPRPSSLCQGGVFPLGSCSLNNGFDFQEDCSTTIVPRWGKRIAAVQKPLRLAPPFPGGISADSPGSRSAPRVPVGKGNNPGGVEASAGSAPREGSKVASSPRRTPKTRNQPINPVPIRGPRPGGPTDDSQPRER
jgi:hypothetical protein